mgnify:CR=1 FL=1
MFYINKHPFVDKVLNTSLQKKGYYFDKDEKEITFEVAVAENDMGKIIGKQGRIAKAIRTVVKAVAAKEKKKISIEFIG